MINYNKIRSLIRKVAEREGFEPSVGFNTHTRLAGEHHRPARSSLRSGTKKLAEEVGFEPTELSFNGFQDRRLQPLGHSSCQRICIYHFTKRLSTSDKRGGVELN